MPLQKKQQEVFDNVLIDPGKKAICLYGSSRSGKTFLDVYYCIIRALAYPASYHLFVRATLTALTTGVITQTFPGVWKMLKADTGIDYMTAMTDTGKKFVEFKANPYNRFIFHNGSEIRFVGLDKQTTNATALDKVLSQEYMTITIEEGPEVDFEVVEMLKTRLAQKALHWQLGTPGVTKLIVTLNPRLFEDWDYVYFQKKLNPIDHTPVLHPEQLAFVHFALDDNIENVSEDYLETLQSLSSSKQLRFLAGQHGDDFEGEVFKKIYWEPLPPIMEFEEICIYTDPSYKSGPKNDFKASMCIGKRKGAYWVIDGRAMQTVTSQMIMNVHDIYRNVVMKGWHRPVRIWFENAGMPDDFVTAVQTHAINSGWTCPYILDGRDKGDKFSRIESILEPLNRDGKLFFNEEMKSERIGNLVVVQFLNFKRHLLPTEHDDIPDAIHGGITLLNTPIIPANSTTMIDRRKGLNIG